MKAYKTIFKLALLGCMLGTGFGCGRSDSSSSGKEPQLILYCGAGVRPAAEKLIIAFEEQQNISVAATDRKSVV